MTRPFIEGALVSLKLFSNLVDHHKLGIQTKTHIFILHTALFTTSGVAGILVLKIDSGEIPILS